MRDHRGGEDQDFHPHDMMSKLPPAKQEEVKKEMQRHHEAMRQILGDNFVPRMPPGMEHEMR